MTIVSPILAPLLMAILSPSASCWAFISPRPSVIPSIGSRQQHGFSAAPSTTSQAAASIVHSSSKLHSLHPLIEEIASMANNSNDNDTPVIFVGGKGGVGKTSISSALAVELASSFEHDLNVLIVSTDPAHSLGDALDVDLRPHATSGNDNDGSTQPRPLTLSDPLTNRKLHALEVDPRAALADFQRNLELFDIDTLSSSIGMNVSPQLLEDLGLNELNSLIKNPPPGLDELVALSNVLDPKYAEEYDVIIVDTAPTGHTLRMLQLPQFLDGFLQTLLTLRTKLKSLVNTLQMFMGGNNNKNQGNLDPAKKLTVDDALEALENFQQRASQLRLRLQDSSSTKFVVVSIPTILSVRESQRLMGELDNQGICVSDLVVNQCVGGSGDDGGSDGNDGPGSEVSESMKRYYDRRVAGQQRWISELTEACEDVSTSDEYRSNDDDDSGIIQVTEVPFYDMELIGAPALGYLGAQTFGASQGGESENNNFERLVGFDQDDVDPETNNPKIVICGGKGGVGKTTTSSSLAIAMASSGHNVALVSTDPAHSLGDALDMNLNGGLLVDVPLFGIPPIMMADGQLGGVDEGSLKAMEIDPTSALKEFRDSIDQLIGRNDSDGSELSSTLSSLGEIIDTLPAGTDEVVALAKVIQLIRRNKFDRVVLDTAPTGHTLRMLTTPSFLADLIEKVLVVARKMNSNAAVKLLISSAAKQNSKYDLDDAAESAKSALLKFQVSMYDLEDLFADPAATEFLIVTIGTELAVRESVRLLNDLTFGDPDMPIRVRNVVVNQVLDSGCSSSGGEDGGDNADEKLQGFVTRLTKSQSSSIEEIHRAVGRLDNPPRVTKVTMLDMEPRGVYGLKALSEQLISSKQAAEEVSNA
eukprot:CAMPEP_0172303728 /NCGR_PEP_ID=MMETSP1058-20130122/5239_1 /TAXON_ID=83371 /ORGANISM="Detonula confervacea, Strain CCMP 353" /LENGTH=870 /DNA_ID=CAMNT_0013014671 /DNA_START=33 /DNA_END=2645 /DNA_ORIENTATION=-